MPINDRRDFLQAGALTVVAVAGAAATLEIPQRTQGSANDSIVMGAIGCGGQGTHLARSFAAMPDARVAYVCDCDQEHAARAAREVEQASGKAPKVVHDLRQVLDDPAVQAVTVATPDHWHGPAALLAMAAGKHVYVEKPCAHNIREGRLLLDTARRLDRIVQVGTQSRSADHVQRAMKLLSEGAIGDVLVAKAWNSQLRANIGHATPSSPPAGIDYEMWLGPVPEVSYQANRHHYTWHWWYDFGTGDMGNDGVHDIDIARWGLGVTTHPNRVAACGGKYGFDDDQQFADTQYVSFEYDTPGVALGKKQLVFEQRIWAPYKQDGFENGNAFYGTKGYLLLGKSGGWKMFGPKNEPKESMSSPGFGSEHHRDFLNAVRDHRRPNADIEIGHFSSSLCHLGNIATRIGRTLHFDGVSEQIVGDDEANQLVRRKYRDGHWAVPAGV